MKNCLMCLRGMEGRGEIKVEIQAWIGYNGQ